ncbi:signal peptidase II [Candidatus Uhrbacteria bacterium]|nr:signal peptidase II [Candidatus Uhrbacteria bacterium]
MAIARILVVIFMVDVAVKWWARTLLARGVSFALPTPAGMVGIVPSVNEVLAFSFPVVNAWIWPVGWVLFAVLLWLAWRSHGATRIALVMILLGATSNLAERTVWGGVTDYLSVTDLYPALNIADLLVLCGVVGWARAGRGDSERVDR